MISLIHCASEKRVYRFTSGNKLSDAREGSGWLYWCIGNSLIKNSKPFGDDTKIRLLNLLM